MSSIFGILNATDRSSRVDGLEDYRPVGSFSFIGRYRIIDFMISNMSNSGISQMQVFTGTNPLSLSDHLGTGRQYNINSKRGRLHILFSKHAFAHNLYNTEITCYMDNLEVIEDMPHEYVVIAPTYMVYTQNFSELLDNHLQTGADITMLYHSVETAKEEFLTNYTLTLNREREVTGFELNNGAAKNRNIFLDTYIMKKELFLDLIHRATKTSSLYSFHNIVSDSIGQMKIIGVQHKGYLASINDFYDYYNANMRLINFEEADSLFDENWPIYTKTNDSPPTRYLEKANVKDSIVSNGCVIAGTVENSIIGRNCVIEKGAIIKNCIVLGDVRIAQNVHMAYQVVDKHSRIEHVKRIISEEQFPGYIRRGDRI